MIYAWVKVVHVFAVVAWMAGIFYLPRLYVYHSESTPGSEKAETFKVMERRLLFGIMTPAMVLTWIAGATLASMGGLWGTGWLSGKFVLVILMTGFHVWLMIQRKAFAEDRNQVPTKTYRMLNELPTVLLLGILILVIVQPF